MRQEGRARPSQPTGSDGSGRQWEWARPSDPRDCFAFQRKRKKIRSVWPGGPTGLILQARKGGDSEEAEGARAGVRP